MLSLVSTTLPPESNGGEEGGKEGKNMRERKSEERHVEY